MRANIKDLIFGVHLSNKYYHGDSTSLPYSKRLKINQTYE